MKIDSNDCMNCSFSSTLVKKTAENCLTTDDWGVRVGITIWTRNYLSTKRNNKFNSHATSPNQNEKRRFTK